MFTLSLWRYLAFSLHMLSLKLSGFLFENSSAKEDDQRSAMLNVLNVTLSTTCLLIGKMYMSEANLRGDDDKHKVSLSENLSLM